MDRIRWGILSTARIATEKVIPAMQQSDLGVVSAIASRSRQRARAAASRLGISRARICYEALLDDPEIDAVYVPLPNHLHVDWSIRALRAGKHMLCEKPLGLSAEDAVRLVREAERHGSLKITEGFLYRFHPQWQVALELVRGGGIGELETDRSVFTYHNVSPNNIRNRKDTGGGAFLDIGCYGVSLAHFFFGEEPEHMCGHLVFDSGFATDRLASGVLAFPSGTATFTCGTQLARFEHVQALGDRGRIEIESPFNARPARLLHTKDGKTETVMFDPSKGFRPKRTLSPVPC